MRQQTQPQNQQSHHLQVKIPQFYNFEVESDKPATGNRKQKSKGRVTSMDKACQAKGPLPTSPTPQRASEAHSPGVGVQTE